MSTPSPNRANGRAAGGRFATGNAGGPGNPHAKHVGELRAALFQAVSPKDMMDVIDALLTKAKSGDVPAMRELFERVLGKPVEADLFARLEEIERILDERKGQP